MFVQSTRENPNNTSDHRDPEIEATGAPADMRLPRCECLWRLLRGPLHANSPLLAFPEGDSPASTPAEELIPREVCTGVSWEELMKIRLLSDKGGSCDVWECMFNGERVAAKVLRDASSKTAQEDIQNEAAILRVIGERPHRNVVQLIGEGCTADGRAFLLLSLVGVTLFDQLPKPCVPMFTDTATAEPDEVGYLVWWNAAAKWPMRRTLRVAHQLALALNYLHEEALPGHRILHRDLKPDNIGFLRSDGSVVLFDFGLASQWKIDSAAEGRADLGTEETRRLTGQTGSARYMAPEVALNQPYNYKAEVFSFGTILWQLAAHDRPFKGMRNFETYEERVARGGERPRIKSSWPPGLQELIADCWHVEPSRRPDFGAIVRRLQMMVTTSQASTPSIAPSVAPSTASTRTARFNEVHVEVA